MITIIGPEDLESVPLCVSTLIQVWGSQEENMEYCNERVNNTNTIFLGFAIVWSLKKKSCRILKMVAKFNPRGIIWFMKMKENSPIQQS